MSRKIALPDGVGEGMVVHLSQEDVAELLELYEVFDTKNDYAEVGVSAGGGQIAVWIRPTGEDLSLVEKLKDEVLESFLLVPEGDHGR